MNQHFFASLEELREFATARLWRYKNERPNMGIGGMAPAQKKMMVA